MNVDVQNNVMQLKIYKIYDGYFFYAIDNVISSNALLLLSMRVMSWMYHMDSF